MHPPLWRYCKKTERFGFVLCDKHCILFLFILKQVSTLHGYDGIDENGRDGGAQMSNILESSLTIE